MIATPRIIPVGQELPPLLTPDEIVRLETRPAVQRDSQAEEPPKDSADRRRTRDRFGVLNAFADHGARLVNTTAQACWWILFRETKPDELATVSHQQIAERIGVSRLTVTRALHRLENAGLLTIVTRGGRSVGATVFRVHGTPKGASS